MRISFRFLFYFDFVTTTLGTGLEPLELSGDQALWREDVCVGHAQTPCWDRCTAGGVRVQPRRAVPASVRCRYDGLLVRRQVRIGCWG